MLVVFFFFFILSYAAADNAGDYDSYGHRRCWTVARLVLLLLQPAPRQAGMDRSVVLLVAVRVALRTTMAELCFSVDGFILDFSATQQ